MEIFELKWQHIERLQAASASTTVGGSDAPIQIFCGRLMDQTFSELATALEIVLRCKTFSPGFFECDNSGNWSRAGERKSK